MNHPKISLIVPVYNVEKYLRECLDSCINQTLREIEIICINDASPDGSAEILAEYEQKDDRITIVTHKENRGLGGARNSGVSIAAGEYIWFIDSDDFISPVACELLYNSAVVSGVDILQCLPYISFTDSESGKELSQAESVYCDTAIFYPQTQYGNPFYMYVASHSYLCKTSYLKKIPFREGAVFEDTDHTPILFASAESILQVAGSFYYRRLHCESITGSPLTEKRIFDMVQVVVSLTDFLRNNNIPPNHFVYRFSENYFYFVRSRISNLDRSRAVLFHQKMPELEKFYKGSLGTRRILRIPKRLLKAILPYGLVRLIQKRKVKV